MERKKELKHLYKEQPIEAGVYQIKNNINQKILIGSTKNIKTINGIRFMLETGAYTPNKELQNEWNEYGKDAFRFDIIEILKKKDEPFFNEKQALEEMEKKWLDRLRPFGERGYNQFVEQGN
ncbi:GIY-YIG nuclease family protein [Alkalihalobacillus oceani]|uniref:GIY-YIG nuclease family protein n=1 Tax=Halalkalibacter oceani TaxID=1653776 RepID=UPI002040952C|nr:GIY-YIG nuclease family protein [Halalkalibacter oceani]MCM3761968.1 GIY-YIG nuclease family protein [Halalkalibacter oceani]